MFFLTHSQEAWNGVFTPRVPHCVRWSAPHLINTQLQLGYAFSVAQTFLSAVSQGFPACESLETGNAANQCQRPADSNVHALNVAQTFLSAVSQGFPACESLETGNAANQRQRPADSNVRAFNVARHSC